MNSVVEPRTTSQQEGSSCLAPPPPRDGDCCSRHSSHILQGHKKRRQRCTGIRKIDVNNVNNNNDDDDYVHWTAPSSSGSSTMPQRLLLMVCLACYLQATATAHPLWDSVLHHITSTGAATQTMESTSTTTDRRRHGSSSATCTPRSSSIHRRSSKPTFLSKLSTHVVAFAWNRTAIEASAPLEYDNNNNTEVASDNTSNTLLARVITSTKQHNPWTNNAWAEQVRSKLLSIANNTVAAAGDGDSSSTRSGFDWMGAVSTTQCSTRTRRRHTRTRTRSRKRVVRGGGQPTNGPIAIATTTETSSSSSDDEDGVLDRFARSLVLTVGKLVALQSAATWWFKGSRRGVDWIQQLVDRLLSEESATAVRSIRTMLTSMEDHGIVDVFAKYSSQDIAASFYALYRLQRAANRYQRLDESSQQHAPPKDLLHVLEDLSHYVIYATAAYGWKMDLAFKGKLHLGNEQALMRKTGIEREDIIHLSLKSKAHLPVFFLVRDRTRKALVLCVRGTWSARDVLTDLCCTAEEYESPFSSSSSSKRQDGGTTCTGGQRQRYCAHHGMLEAAMAVAIEMEDDIDHFLEENPEYSLVLVGHSMGAGVASLLATFWEHKFNNIKTYLFGGPCVAPLDSHPTNCTNIINVISEGDPFRCLSLGHIADVSAAVAHFCEAQNLRRIVLTRSDDHLDDMCMSDLEFCFETMEMLRKTVMTNPDKMFPPGRLFHVNRPAAKGHTIAGEDSDTEFDDASSDDSADGTDGVVIHEVGPAFFQELIISPKMFDISRHLPSLYEDTLRDLIDSERGQNIVEPSDD